ncbi:MAG TPA: LysM peptidoglycan-binding domain-containing protein [Candidatus Limnocylindrales bacterium]|nr:LysM peptidoglycan-binding domain-containing protein [Candidatus Limnocylindrales bacterium]
MTDRGLPIVDGAPACPFVAFEDDRDARATAPDHRHRCFAEARPAPRALAHQEAYCLSSAFPVCPTFQDWARREAAAARPAPGGNRAPEPEPPVSSPLPPLDREAYRAPGEELPDDGQPRRNQQRDWAAPPPWAAGAAAAGAAGASAGAGVPGAGAAAAAQVPDPTPPEARGLAGSAADRLAGPDPSDPLSPAPSRAAGPYDGSASRIDPTGGDRPAAAPYAAAAAVPLAAAAHDDLDDEPDWGQPEPAGSADRASPAGSSRQPVREDPRPPAPSHRDQVSRRQAQDPNELFGPAWERPRRYEAYPSLRTRVGLPAIGGIGRVGLGALALLVAALALFFVGPMLLGIGSDQPANPGGGAGATATPIVEDTATPEPTPVPAPTPQVYVVKKGDTMSKIAKKFDLTIEQLLAANPQIKNPNKIAIGDEITIPVPDAAGDGSVQGASATP